MTLQTFNHYVDHVTGVSRIRHSSEQLGEVVAGEGGLYWTEPTKRKPFKAKGKHRKEKPRVFFRQLFPIPRKPLLFHKLVKLFRGW